MAKYVRKNQPRTVDMGGPKKDQVKRFTRNIKKKIAQIDPDPLFSSMTSSSMDIGGRERFTHDSEILRSEWAIKYPNTPPYRWLQDLKGYNENQAQTIVAYAGGIEEWHKERERLLDKMTESVVKRHIDQLAEVQETHIRSSKLGLARAVQMLTEGGRTRVDMETGLKKCGTDGKPIVIPLSPGELVGCMVAIEKAQMIYRRSMGLPNEEAGLAQILDKIQVHYNQTNIQNNVTVEAPKESEAEIMAKSMTQEQIEAFVEFRREEKARKLALEAKTT